MENNSKYEYLRIELLCVFREYDDACERKRSRFVTSQVMLCKKKAKGLQQSTGHNRKVSHRLDSLLLLQQT